MDGELIVKPGEQVAGKAASAAADGAVSTCWLGTRGDFRRESEKPV